MSISPMSMFAAKGRIHALSREGRWTLVGASAIPLWALWPLFAVNSADNMPPLQFLSIVYAAGAITLLGLRSPFRLRRSIPARRSGAWLAATGMVTFGIAGSNVLFLMAIAFMPAAEANLIVYLWPLMMVLIAAGLGILQLQGKHLFAIVLGLCGVGTIIGPGNMEGSLPGLSLALMSGLAWAIYCVFRLAQQADVPDALTSGLVLSAILTALGHFTIETTALPTAGAVLSSVVTGALALALPNLAWDVGIRHGNRMLLSVFAYATPLMAALVLIAFGRAEVSLGLLTGGLLIVAGSAISARR